MAMFSRRTTTEIRHEYVTPKTSANWTEIDKMFSAARNDMPEDMRDWDDTVWVDADDENIIVYWKETK